MTTACPRRTSASKAPAFSRRSFAVAVFISPLDPPSAYSGVYTSLVLLTLRVTRVKHVPRAARRLGPAVDMGDRRCDARGAGTARPRAAADREPGATLRAPPPPRRAP